MRAPHCKSSEKIHVANQFTFPRCECGRALHPLKCTYEECVAAIEAGDERYGTFLENLDQGGSNGSN